LQIVPPAVPENVRLEVLSNDSVRITWNAVYGAISYRVYRASGSETATYNSVATVRALSHTDTGLVSGQRFYYKISAVSNVSNESAQSDIVTVFTPPGNVRASAVTTVSANLVWDASNMASGYNIYRSDIEDGDYIKLNSNIIAGAGFADTGLLPETTYYYKVSAISGEVESLQSNQVPVTTLSPVPTNVRLSSATTVSVSLEWNLIAGSDGYNVYRSDSIDGIYSKINSATIIENRFTNTGLSPETSYYYKISSINGGIESLQSAVISTATLTPVPANVRVSSSTIDSVGLAWNLVSGASGYNIYRSDGETGTYIKINTGEVAVAEYIDTVVLPYSTYYYKVSAIVAGFERAQSNFVSANTGIQVPGGGLGAKLAWLQNNADSNNLYGIELFVNENIGSQTISYNGKTNITIVLNLGESKNSVIVSGNGSRFSIGSGVTLILDDNIVLNAINIYVISSGTFIMNNGEISGNETTSNGGGVYMSGGNFIMNGGKISDNHTNASGGGVYIDEGTFTMNGGEIVGNASNGTGTFRGGGGVYISYGNFTMNNGKITGNVSNGDGIYAGGGGVFFSGGTFIMKGGEISGNIHTGTGTLNGGGGILVTDAMSSSLVFQMSGGVIYGSNAATVLKNTAGGGAALFYYNDYYNRNTVQYGTFNGNTFRRTGYLTSTNDTIRIVNGNLLNF